MSSDWKRVSKDPPREGQTVLGYNRDMDEVSIYVYRKGVFHVRGHEHFQGWTITWWAPLPHPPLGQPRGERKRRKRALRRREMDRRRRTQLPTVEAK
jgi:hypothetical protein